MVRDLEKAKTTFPSDDDSASALKIVKCDLASENDIISCVTENGCDSAVWCATAAEFLTTRIKHSSRRFKEFSE